MANLCNGRVSVRLTDYIDRDVEWLMSRITQCDMISRPWSPALNRIFDRAERLGLIEPCTAPNGAPAWRQRGRS